MFDMGNRVFNIRFLISNLWLKLGFIFKIYLVADVEGLREEE